MDLCVSDIFLLQFSYFHLRRPGLLTLPLYGNNSVPLDNLIFICTSSGPLLFVAFKILMCHWVVHARIILCILFSTCFLTIINILFLIFDRGYHRADILHELHYDSKFSVLFPLWKQLSWSSPLQRQSSFSLPWRQQQKVSPAVALPSPFSTMSSFSLIIILFSINFLNNFWHHQIITLLNYIFKITNFEQCRSLHNSSQKYTDISPPLSKQLRREPCCSLTT